MLSKFKLSTVPPLSQLGLYQSVVPAVRHGDLAVSDLQTVLQTFPHLVRFDISFSLSSGGLFLSRLSQTSITIAKSFAGNSYRGLEKKREPFSLSQCFIFMSTLCKVYLYRYEILMQGIAPHPSENGRLG